MKAKLQVLLIAIFSVFALNVMAQNNNEETVAQDLTDKMKKALSLNDNQTSQIKSINVDYVKKVYELKKQYANNKTELEKQIKENNADREVKARKVLTEQQYQTYLKKVAEFEVKK